MNLLMLIGGLLLLLVGGDWLVRSGVSLAGRFKIPPLIIGLTIVSIGTSTPELMVSVKAALGGFPDMAMGNVIGSNIANISLILGLTALVIAIPVSKETVVFTWPVMFLASLMLFVFALNYRIERWEGIILVLSVPVFIYVLWLRSKKTVLTQPSETTKIYSIFVSLLILVLSMAALMFGADFMIKGAVGIASSLGVSERVIAVTVVAFGTSVPELATSLVAAFRKQMDISVGNLIGSNIFNILGILGISSIIKPVGVSQQMLHLDIPVAIGIALMVGLCFIPLKRPVIGRLKGFMLLSMYLIYFFIVFN